MNISQLGENNHVSRKSKQGSDVVRVPGSKPLSNLNYQQHVVKHSESMEKKQKPDVTNQSLKLNCGNLPKQKISLSEYRERSKQKHHDDYHIEKFEALANSTVRMVDDVNKSRAMSIDADDDDILASGPSGIPSRSLDTSIINISDVSLDLENMSIDNTSIVLDDKTGQLLKDGEVISKNISSSNGNKKDVHGSNVSANNNLKLKKNSAEMSDSHQVKSSLHQQATNPTVDKTLPERPKQAGFQGDTTVSGAFATKGTVQSFASLKSGTDSTSSDVHIQGSETKSSAVKQTSQWTDIRQQRDIGEDLKTLKLSIDLDERKRIELENQLKKQKSIVATVNMSKLQDKGARLIEIVEKLMRDINSINKTMKEKKIRLDFLMKNVGGMTGGNTVVKNKQPQVIKIHPNGEAERMTMSNTEFKSASGIMASHSQQILPKPPQVIKIYPGGEQSNLASGHHQPHNPQQLRQTSLLPHVAQIPPHILQQMYAANPQAMQLYGGRMTAARLREVGSVTKEAIEKLHKQLETCPEGTDEISDPKGINVSLMVHQRQALLWLTWRERQSPSGGILADDMGLGKTLTMIALVLKQNESKEKGSEEEQKIWLNRDKQLEKMGKSIVKSNATLIISPASLIHHWKTEIERRCKPGLLRVCLYHGANRERNILKLAAHDVVLTTYNIVAKEVVLDDKDKNGDQPIKDEDPETDSKTAEDGDNPPMDPKQHPNIMRIAWERIILDEAHNIKNHKSLQSRAVCRLRSGFRWALTGTPIQNDLLDMYSLLRFLRCTPFDEHRVWKKQVDTGNAMGQNRLNVLVKCLLLRRTKSQNSKVTGKALVPLPPKTSTTHQLQLSEQEKQVYDKVFAQSKSVLKEYLRRHEEKELVKDGKLPTSNPFLDKSPVTSLHTGHAERGGVNQSDVNQPGNVKAQQILVMLLRLRQCCCHLSLMKDAFDEETQQDEGLELTLEEQMMDLLLEDESKKDSLGVTKSSVIFKPESVSTKMKALLDELRKIHTEGKKEERCKSVIVSQWTKMLDIVSIHLKNMNIKYAVIQGNIPAKKRMDSVDMFNNEPDGPQVMLVSLRAGGCGLNLIGGNHLFLLDSHWNPQLEEQACDRIYRMGQTKNVYIHRFLCKETVEEKILQLQTQKLDLANNVLSGGAVTNSKLTLADLRHLFGV